MKCYVTIKALKCQQGQIYIFLHFSVLKKKKPKPNCYLITYSVCFLSPSNFIWTKICTSVAIKMLFFVCLGLLFVWFWFFLRVKKPTSFVARQKIAGVIVAHCGVITSKY